MKPSSELFDLIQTLTPNEKGYFKKHCQRSGSTSRKYIKLFDAIATQKKYDEEAVRKKLKDPVLERNLSSEKNYLYHLILEALLTSNSSGDPTYEMTRLLAKAKWLATHSFYEAAMRFIRKISAWAEENELFVLHLEALDLEWLLWQYMPNDERRTIEAIAEHRLKVMDRLAQTDRMRTLDIRVIRLFQETGIGREDSDLSKYREIFDESRRHAPKPETLPVRALIFYYNISVFYHNVSGKAEESLDDLQALIRLMDANALIKRERLSFYISSLNNLILLLLHLGRYDEAKETISSLESARPDTQSQRNTVFITLYNTRFDLYTYTRDWNAAAELSRKLKAELPEFENLVDNRYTGHIRFAAFRSCYYCGEWKEALHWINQLVQKTEGEPFKTELLTIARICELIVHETLGNYDLLEKLADSASRYLEKNHSLYQFETLMLDYFRDCLKNPGDKTPLTSLQSKLTEIGNDLLDKRVFMYFDFRAWAEARLKAKTVAEVLG